MCKALYLRLYWASVRKLAKHFGTSMTSLDHQAQTIALRESVLLHVALRRVRDRIRRQLWND